MPGPDSVDTLPFGPLAALIHRRQPDDVQYIDKLRKTLHWWDRWRWLGIALHGAILAAMICLGYRFAMLTREMQALFPGANPNADQVVFLAACVGANTGLCFITQCGPFSWSCQVSAARDC
jgi:hypothetical protein